MNFVPYAGIIWLICLLDVLMLPRTAFEHAGVSKDLWSILVFLLGPVLWVVFAVTKRRQVRAFQ